MKVNTFELTLPFEEGLCCPPVFVTREGGDHHLHQHSIPLTLPTLAPLASFTTLRFRGIFIKGSWKLPVSQLCFWSNSLNTSHNVNCSSWAAGEPAEEQQLTYFHRNGLIAMQTWDNLWEGILSWKPGSCWQCPSIYTQRNSISERFRK